MTSLSFERKTVSVLGTHVDALTFEQALERIEAWVREKAKTYVCIAPVSTLVTALDNERYQAVLNNADMVTPDGVPVVWIAHWRGYKDVERVCGPDLMWRICTDPCMTHLRHFFLGTTPDTLEQLEGRLKHMNADVNIAGMYAPPFYDKACLASEDLVRMVNRAEPDILWVGMGSPKQDFWMQMNREQFDAPVMIGSGAAFDFLSGVKMRAPKWMQRCGLEWFFRLCAEPRRLWRRYVVGNSRFIFELTREFLKEKKTQFLRKG